MLEKIPVGGWRHAESRVVEVFAGKAKARDVVPNWPRGRSTSKPYTDQVMVPKDWLPDGWKALKWGDLNAAVDREIALAEERRKAEMMEGWYEQQRIEARGPLYPQKDDGFAVYRAKLDMLINEVKP